MTCAGEGFAGIRCQAATGEAVEDFMHAVLQQSVELVNP
jgi:hypothetical protein